MGRIWQFVHRSARSRRSSGSPTARGWRFGVVCGLLPAVLAVALVSAPLSSWAQLPATVAVHWSLGGLPDRASSKSAAFLHAAAYGCLGAAVMWKLVWRRADGVGATAGGDPEPPV